MRTPRTCPAHRWPWAISASRRYWSRDFIGETLGSRLLLFSFFLLPRLFGRLGFVRPARNRITALGSAQRLKGDSHRLLLPDRRRTLRIGIVSCFGRANIGANHRLALPPWSNHRIEFLPVGYPAVGGVVAKPADDRVKRVEVGKTDF